MLLVRIKNFFFLRISIFEDNRTVMGGLKSPFSVVSVYAESSFLLDIKKIKIGNCSIYVHVCISLKFDFSKILNINGTRPFQPRIFLSAYSSFFLRPRRIRGKYLSTYGECAESI
jgi:hypothetical protein